MQEDFLVLMLVFISSGGCTYKGNEYDVGEKFYDGCMSCTCDSADGAFSCVCKRGVYRRRCAFYNMTKQFSCMSITLCKDT